jgi:cytochrome c2
MSIAIGDVAIRLLCAAAFAAAASAARADGDSARGEKKFEECQACHSLDRNAESLGPSLYGVFERKAGASADFRFSPAMKRSGITWTPRTVETFIADPQSVVPANRMPYAGMPNEADRADLVAFLQKAFK